jgi:hypothetical protein
MSQVGCLNKLWRDTLGDMPDSGQDFGEAELEREDGTVVTGTIFIDDYWTGDDEDVPIIKVRLADESETSIFDFVRWRRVGYWPPSWCRKASLKS